MRHCYHQIILYRQWNLSKIISIFDSFSWGSSWTAVLSKINLDLGLKRSSRGKTDSSRESILTSCTFQKFTFDETLNFRRFSKLHEFGVQRSQEPRNKLAYHLSWTTLELSLRFRVDPVGVVVVQLTRFTLVNCSLVQVTWPINALVSKFDAHVTKLAIRYQVRGW